MQERFSKKKEIGRRLRTYREAARVRAVAAAEAIHVQRQFVYDLENGKKNLTLEKLQILSTLYKVDMNLIVNGRLPEPVEGPTP